MKGADRSDWPLAREERMLYKAAKTHVPLITFSVTHGRVHDFARDPLLNRLCTYRWYCPKICRPIRRPSSLSKLWSRRLEVPKTRPDA